MVKKVVLACIFSTLVFSTGTFAASNPGATGDIVARDLNINGLGWAGHVGMWTGSKVLEVLNEKGRVIQQNSLSDFKGRSSYWGARYGKGYKPYRAVSWGWNQRSYNPQYTLTAQYQTGGWVEQRVWDRRKQKYITKRVKRDAKYRCDTFVAMSYKEGDRTTLVRYTITPREVYNSMPRLR
jgi:hypothetical protein